MEYECLAEGIWILFASIVGLDESEDVCAIKTIHKVRTLVWVPPELYRRWSQLHLTARTPKAAHEV